MTYSAAEVAALRTMMGLSMDGLARMLDVNPRTIRSWESGRDRMSETAADALTALVQRWRNLAALYADTEEIIAIPRERADDTTPRGWHLSAAGAAMARDLDDAPMIEWA